jgi:hypothetical protein
VTVNATVKTPGVLNCISPGSSTVESGIPEPAPKFHRKLNGRLPSGSVPVPEKVTDSPGLIVMFWIGASMIPFGAWFAGVPFPRTFSSATEVHGFPFTSDNARSRTYRPPFALKRTSFSAVVLAKAPEATGEPQLVPSPLT